MRKSDTYICDLSFPLMPEVKQQVRLDYLDVHVTLLQYSTQVRFRIHLKIPTEYNYRIPRLPENQKDKIP